MGRQDGNGWIRWIDDLSVMGSLPAASSLVFLATFHKDVERTTLKVQAAQEIFEHGQIRDLIERYLIQEDGLQAKILPKPKLTENGVCIDYFNDLTLTCLQKKDSVVGFAYHLL